MFYKGIDRAISGRVYGLQLLGNSALEYPFAIFTGSSFEMATAEILSIHFFFQER